MHEQLMEAIVSPERVQAACEAVIRNKGKPGIDGMTVDELKGHLQAHGDVIRDKLLKGTYVPSPVRQVRVPEMRPLAKLT